jgi:hypothetical protein
LIWLKVAKMPAKRAVTSGSLDNNKASKVTSVTRY